MVLNLQRGGAAVNVLARELRARVLVADLGVAVELPVDPALHSRQGRAPTTSPRDRRWAGRGGDGDSGRPAAGQRAARRRPGFGANRRHGDRQHDALSCVVCHFIGLDAAQVVGRGTGVDDTGLAPKVDTVRRFLEMNRQAAIDPLGARAALGGFEIAGLVGVILEAASQRRPVVHGEGTGALLALPIERAAVRMLNETATFEEAGVSNREA